MVPCEKSKVASFASLTMKNIVVFPSRSIFPVKLIYWFAFESASSSCRLLKSIAFILNKHNLSNSRLCNNLLDQLQTFICYHMFFIILLLADEKIFFH